MKVPKTGNPLRGENYNIYFDTMHRNSWNGGPPLIDIGIVYPVDSLGDKGGQNGQAIIEDLESRGARKIILISDKKVSPWVSSLNPIHTRYDASGSD